MKATLIIGDSRDMSRINDASIDLALTSPPYWQIKDYGTSGQIGFGQSLHEYLRDLYRVWSECFRVLRAGRRLCINIGDQFARASIYGRYKIIPLHAEIIAQCERVGFDFMGSIIWQKKTTMNTSGGATIMGSYPYPPNGMIEIDYEHILIFKKAGEPTKVPTDIKEKSALSKEEWREYFSSHWQFGGAKQKEHQAMFPEELPKRLIRMFSFWGETVLDPFLGSGTTAKVACEWGRNAVGYEINPDYMETIQDKVGSPLSVMKQENLSIRDCDYFPTIADANALRNDTVSKPLRELHRVIAVLEDFTLVLESGKKIGLLGLEITDRQQALAYLLRYILKKEVFYKTDKGFGEGGDKTMAYVYLKNKIFVNGYLVKAGLAKPNMEKEYEMKEKFIRFSGFLDK